MLQELQTYDQSKTTLWAIYVWFLRIIAAISLAAGLKYWAQMIGITNNGELRFDLAAQHWRLFATALAVILPSAALGLWLTQAWGVVLWLVAISMEIAAFGIWTELYAPNPVLVIGHCVSVAFLGVMLLALYVQRRQMLAY